MGYNYYPFGLTFNSYKRITAKENNFLYNQGIGEKTFKTERISSLDLNVDMTKFRVMDPAIGRWWQVDPLADEEGQEVYSPYGSMLNNPIRYNDPEGDCIPCLKKLAKAGIKWAARTAKGEFKPVTQTHAKKLLKENKTVYQTSNHSNKSAKKLMKDAKPDKKIVRHDGHELPNGKTGMDHYQPSTGGDAHVNVPGTGSTIALTTTDGGAINNNEVSTSQSTSESQESDELINKVVLMSDPTIGKYVIAGNIGKILLGNNDYGKFVDDWVNPFSLGSDIIEAIKSVENDTKKENIK